MGGSDYRRVEQAIHYLEAHSREQPSLVEVAEHVGLSVFHFQRLFRRWAGVTPKDFLQCLTLNRARGLLSEPLSLLEASLQLGLSGTSRLHDLFLSLEAMTPGEFKRAGQGLTIHWGIHPTPFGDALFAVTQRGLCGLTFLAEETSEEAVAWLQHRWPGASLVNAPLRTSGTAKAIALRMRGAAAGPLSVLLKGSPFQIKVWQALLAVPEGRVISYQGLAHMVGAPGGSRAVGTALAMNPIAFLIPCHRVIRSTGAAGEYRWGGARKLALLGVEGARAAAKGAGVES
jgi:AraC family transcriptional regulator, regulatory protein of adaptative response / methylated-DNA-[protein]-cysteine methyltransferase